MITFVEDDGGRGLAGYKGNARDCVVRAIAIATHQDYQDVYDVLSEGARTQRVTKGKKRKPSARDAGVYIQRKWFKDYMASLGLEWVPTIRIGQGCKVHLTAGELPKGRLVVRVSKHLTAVVNGVLRDTWDCSWSWDRTNAVPSEDRKTWIVPPVKVQGKKCVYGYWIKRDGTGEG
jgi:hypothetical protein